MSIEKLKHTLASQSNAYLISFCNLLSLLDHLVHLQFTKWIINLQNSRQDDERFSSNKEQAVPWAGDGHRKSIRNIASIIVLQDLNLAEEDVQIQALEVWKRPLLLHIILLTQTLASADEAHLHHNNILFLTERVPHRLHTK